MGKSSPTPPTPPDPVKTASAQTGSNIGTAIANATIGNANTYGPTGSTVYNQIGSQKITGPDGQIYGVPQYSQTTTLSPEQQGLYNQQTKLSGDLNNLALGQTARLSDVLGAARQYRWPASDVGCAQHADLGLFRWCSGHDADELRQRVDQ
jgi:hypothetical protein